MLHLNDFSFFETVVNFFTLPKENMTEMINFSLVLPRGTKLAQK